MRADQAQDCFSTFGPLLTDYWRGLQRQVQEFSTSLSFRLDECLAHKEELDLEQATDFNVFNYGSSPK